MTDTFFEDTYFQRESVVDINAAIVGISKVRWESINENIATEKLASDIMKENRYDVLPVITDSEITKYFQTDNWNDYSSISIKNINHRDIIPFRTHIRDVIRGLALESRLFYFLSNNHKIVGLISVVNLNCRQVKVYLFSLLSEVEISLGNFISENINEADLMKLIITGDLTEKQEDINKRYTADREKGVELPFVEYLYLSDLINVILKKELYSTLGYSRPQFEDSFGSLNNFRHKVAHPSRSIITSKNSVKKLWDKIDNIEEALFRLRLKKHNKSLQ